LCIPEHVAPQLQLKTVEMREVILADGKLHKVPYASPVRIALLNRHAVTGAPNIPMSFAMGISNN
jgi:hypothetical protein